MESSSMFVRGGVYVVVRDAMGPFVARLSVSALLFDYILTGPISGVSAGQYLGRLLNDASDHFAGGSLHVPPNLFAVVFAVSVTAYFWWANIKGLPESSHKALQIMKIMTVMIVTFLVWSVVTLIVRGGPAQIPPTPLPSNLQFSKEGLGWFATVSWLKTLPSIASVAMMIAIGHSLLSMSGFETLAQVYREIASPKLKNLKITGNIVCTYALVCTGGITFLAAMIIPDSIRLNYVENLLGGLAKNLAGPMFLRMPFYAFVVVVGVMILSGAVNTSIIGANGVMNRVAEDGVLHPAFQKPHRRFGTTYRIIGLITILQIVTILLSRGQTYLLGEAYAFGIVWSFFLKALSVLVLRFQRHDQEYKTPLNFRIGGIEIPFGLAGITMTLFFVAMANLFSKRIATISGLTFMLVLFAIFTISERMGRKERHSGLEQFNLDMQPDISNASTGSRPGCVLVAVRDYTRMTHLQTILQKANTQKQDIVVMTTRSVSSRTGETDLAKDQLFTTYEQELFSRVVSLAEKEGKPVELLVVPSINPFDALVQSAARLEASRLVTGVSARMDSQELARQIGQSWERLPEPRHPFSLEIISPDRPSVFVNLGPHPPRLWPEDVEVVHDLWLELTAEFGSRIHHRDVVGVALRRMVRDLQKNDRPGVISDVDEELQHRKADVVEIEAEAATKNS
jgi:amino acid transporter